MDEIKRIRPGKRFSECVVFNHVAHISGQTDYKKSRGVKAQMREVLKLIDELLAEAGTDKHHLLQVYVYLADMGDVSEMNQVWEEWVSKECPPARTVAQSANADMAMIVKVSAVAAVP